MHGTHPRILVAVLLSSIPTGLWAEPLLQTIVLTGEELPGVPGSKFNSSHTPPTINNLGQIAFHIISPREAIWTNAHDPNGEIIAMDGEDVPGATTGSRFGSLGIPKLNDHGQIAFTGSINSTPNSAGVWLYEQGQVAPLALRGQHSPGFAEDQVFSSFFNPIINNSTGVSFYASTRSSGPISNGQSGIWTFNDDSLQFVLRGEWGPLSTNDLNALAYPQRISSGHPTTDSGIWVADGESRTLIAQENSSGDGGGDFVAQGISPSINQHGQVAFGACSAGFLCYSAGVWVGDGTTLTPIALSGQSVTVDGRTYTFSPSFTQVAINDLGTVAFAAEYLEEGSDLRQRGVWVSSNGTLRAIGNISDGLPGVEPNYDYDGVRGIALNNRDQVAFQTGRGIWATDLQGNVQPIAIIGGLLDVDDGPEENLRTIRLVGSLLNGQHGGASGFNDRGEVAFWANFAMSSNVDDGIFISRIVAVPEPTCVVQAVWVSSIIALCIRLRRRKRWQASD